MPKVSCPPGADFSDAVWCPDTRSKCSIHTAPQEYGRCFVVSERYLLRSPSVTTVCCGSPSGDTRQSHSDIELRGEYGAVRNKRSGGGFAILAGAVPDRRCVSSRAKTSSDVRAHEQRYDDTHDRDSDLPEPTMSFNKGIHAKKVAKNTYSRSEFC